MKRNIIILVSLFVLITVLVLTKNTEYSKKAYSNIEKPYFCSEEAKVCPDGSTVARTGPKCEFTACPPVKTTPKPPVIETPETPDGSSQDKTKDNEVVFCTMEAKMCPDGSYVGRIGPDCEFAACPADPKDEVKEPEPTASGQEIGQSREYDGVVITPVSVKEDSRCKEGTQCIWAGRLIVTTKIEKSSAGTTFAAQIEKIISSNVDLEMGVAYSYEGRSITLVSEADGKYNFEVK